MVYLTGILTTCRSNNGMFPRLAFLLFELVHVFIIYVLEVLLFSAKPSYWWGVLPHKNVGSLLQRQKQFFFSLLCFPHLSYLQRVNRGQPKPKSGTPENTCIFLEWNCLRYAQELRMNSSDLLIPHQEALCHPLTEILTEQKRVAEDSGSKESKHSRIHP